MIIITKILQLQLKTSKNIKPNFTKINNKTINITMTLILQQLVSQPTGLHCDIQPLQVCITCFTGIIIMLIYLYALYVFGKQILNIAQRFYDLLDMAVICFTAICVIVDLVALIMFNQIGNVLSLICKFVWTFMMLLVFLKFQFHSRRFKVALFLAVFILVYDYVFFIYKFNLIPIRTSLAIQILTIFGIAVSQVYKISIMLKSTKKPTFVPTSQQHQSIPQLTTPIYEQYIKIDPQTQAHLHNRRSFCIVMGASLMVSLAFLWDLSESKDGIGQILIIFFVQILPLGTSWIYLKKKQKETRESELNISQRRSSHIQMINIEN